MSDPVKLQNRIHYTFRNPELLKAALTHRSFAMENHLEYSNQRLEFLGDAVLQIILTEYLFHRYREFQEGELTKIRSALANQDILAEFARDIDLGDALLLGHGEQESGGCCRDSTISDAMEALLGAMFLDSSLEQTRSFLLDLMLKKYPDPSLLLLSINPKGILQEYTQKKYGEPPVYRVIDLSGPDHQPVYTVEVSIRNHPVAQAVGAKRKSAESNAAQKVLDMIQHGNLKLTEDKETEQ